jgi:hypothetical protein
MNDFWCSYKESFSEVVITLLVFLISDYHSLYYDKCLRNYSVDAGEQYINEMLFQAHPQRCLEVLYMPLDTFESLITWLKVNGELKDFRSVSTRQQLAIFMLLCGSGLSQRTTAEFFLYSQEIISR